jgi:hypothetical protein
MAREGSRAATTSKADGLGRPALQSQVGPESNSSRAGRIVQKSAKKQNGRHTEVAAHFEFL